MDSGIAVLDSRIVALSSWTVAGFVDSRIVVAHCGSGFVEWVSGFVVSRIVAPDPRIVFGFVDGGFGIVDSRIVVWLRVLWLWVHELRFWIRGFAYCGSGFAYCISGFVDGSPGFLDSGIVVLDSRTVALDLRSVALASWVSVSLFCIRVLWLWIRGMGLLDSWIRALCLWVHVM